MSRWTHNICLECWKEKFGNEPARLAGSLKDTCCYCGEENNDGIYYRDDPESEELLCGGDHD